MPRDGLAVEERVGCRHDEQGQQLNLLVDGAADKRLQHRGQRLWVLDRPQPEQCAFGNNASGITRRGQRWLGTYEHNPHRAPGERYVFQSVRTLTRTGLDVPGD